MERLGGRVESDGPLEITCVPRKKAQILEICTFYPLVFLDNIVQWDKGIYFSKIMEPKFQTSFIPKKPLVATPGNHARHSISIFLTLSVIVFIISIAGAGFTYVWQKVLLNQQNQYKIDLAKDQDQFEPDLIKTLTQANTKIDDAKKLLNNHLDVSKVFGIISGLTISSVQWKNFSFSAPSEVNSSPSGPAANEAKISMQGEADNFYSVAYQSDVLGKSSQLGSNMIIKNPVLSNLSVTPDGKVDFSFSAMVDLSELSYMSDSSSKNATSTASAAILPPANQ